MEELKIIYLSPKELTPYEKNAKKHAEDDLATIRASIENFGFRDPVAIWGEKNIIVEGHGRQIVAIEMGLDKIPCIRLDDMTDEQRRAYALAHNKTAEMSGWDFATLEAELAELELDFDMSEFGFDDIQGGADEEQSKYTSETKIPQYDPNERMPEIQELIDTSKVETLIAEIESSKVSEEEKQFLKMAAARHAVIQFDKVADYYAGASEQMQELMERQALVLIDIQDAIANGYTVLSEELENILGA